MRPERHLRPAGGSTVETLVFLPGFMCDARVFSDQILALNAEQAIHLAPLSLDTTIPAMAKKVLEGAPNHLALVGQGLGALVAMDVLRQAPERVSRIALMGCSPLLESPQDAALREPRIVKAQAGQLDAAIREEYPLSAFAEGPYQDQVQEALVQMGLSLGVETFVRQTRALQRRPDQQKVLRQSRLPALVLCGAKDTIVSPRRHQFMAELIPNARLEVIEEAGHMPLLETPERVTRALQEFMAMPMRLM